MTGEMASQFTFTAGCRLLPSTERLGGGGEAGVEAEVVDEAVCAEAVHVFAICVGGGFEG
jgi:hypothetical protein